MGTESKRIPIVGTQKAYGRCMLRGKYSCSLFVRVRARPRLASGAIKSCALALGHDTCHQMQQLERFRLHYQPSGPLGPRVQNHEEGSDGSVATDLCCNIGILELNLWLGSERNFPTLAMTRIEQLWCSKCKGNPLLTLQSVHESDSPLRWLLTIGTSRTACTAP